MGGNPRNYRLLASRAAAALSARGFPELNDGRLDALARRFGGTLP